VASENIADGDEGYINLLGEIRNLNTVAYPIGTVLYIDPDVPGDLTDDVPVSPAWYMPIAIVTRSHASTGIIFIRMWSQGMDLGEVHDVLLDDPEDNEVLTYETSSGLWKNKPAPSAGNIDGGKANSLFGGIASSPLQGGSAGTF
jgi:hypothetical protein